MSLKNNLFKIWKSKGQILEGITNSIFKREDVELIAEYRISICKGCPLYDDKGEGCVLPGSQPCCNENKGGCGCSLSLKTRSLSSSCPHPDGPKWEEEISEEEEDKLNEKLGL